MKLDFEWEEKELAGNGEGCESRKSYFVIVKSIIISLSLEERRINIC